MSTSFDSSTARRAFICGIGGQDGAYLARYLLGLGYTVLGSSRDAEGGRFDNLIRLGIRSRVRIVSMVPEDFRSVFVAVRRAAPDEIYYLAGQSSVGLSFDLPAETLQSVVMGTLNMLEVCRLAEKPVRLYHASSSECFGDTGGAPATETTPFSPRSPYAVAKASAFWLVANYREAYGLYACSGILFNHESPLRPERFVTQKIVSAARRIAAGTGERLALGRVDIARDWGWAPEYVEAMHAMLQLSTPEDFIIATGHTCTLAEFAATAFSAVGLDWEDHVDLSASLARPTDLLTSRALPTRAAERLGWTARRKMPEVVAGMMAGVEGLPERADSNAAALVSGPGLTSALS